MKNKILTKDKYFGCLTKIPKLSKRTTDEIKKDNKRLFEANMKALKYLENK